MLNLIVSKCNAILAAGQVKTSWGHSFLTHYIRKQLWEKNILAI